MAPSVGNDFADWLSQAQWGTVPSWFGGLSLVLAILLFMRDRRRDDREMIDKVAIWPTVSWDQATVLDPPPGPAVGGQLTLHAKNTGDLPIEVHTVLTETTSNWYVPHASSADHGDVGVWTTVPGAGLPIVNHVDFVLLPPDEERILVELPVGLGGQAPETVAQLDRRRGMVTRVQRFLAIDNAGRRWEVRPGRGRRARRIRFYSRLKVYPRGWPPAITHPLTERFSKGRRLIRLWRIRRSTATRPEATSNK